MGDRRAGPGLRRVQNGTKRYFRTPSTPFTWDLITPNGNYLINGSNGLPTRDTLTRTIQFETNFYSNPFPYYERFKTLDANGALQTWQVNYIYPTVWDPYRQNFITLPGKSKHVSSIQLPNGKTWQFEYGPANPIATYWQGFLTKVTFPSGAYIRFEYPTPNSHPYSDYVIKRYVSADGTAGSEKLWDYQGMVWGDYAKTITVLSPETSERVVHKFTAQGTEYETQWQQQVAGTWRTLKTVKPSWSQQAIESNNQPNNPRVNTVTTILDSNLQSTKTVTYDGDLYVTQEKVTEWAFGAAGPVAMQKDLTYTTIGGAYKRVAAETVTAVNPTNGFFELQGKTEFFYDESALTPRYSVPNHTGSTYQSLRGNLTRAKRHKDASGTNFDVDARKRSRYPVHSGDAWSRGPEIDRHPYACRDPQAPGDPSRHTSAKLERDKRELMAALAAEDDESTDNEL